MSWTDYNEEYVMEAYDEMNKYVYNESSELLSMYQLFEASKDGVFKDNFYFRDHLQIPIISKALVNEKVRDEIVIFVAKFLDDHSTQLSAPGPILKFTFGDAETSVLYNIFNTTAEAILAMYKEMVNETYYGKISSFITGWIENAPHKIIVTAMLIEALQKGYNDIVECCEYLLAFTEYPILFVDSWPLGVKEDVMKYTIEHLGNKFKIKEMKNLQEFLKYDTHTSVVAHEARLKTGADNEYIDFIYRIRNQMKNKFINIARAYYENYKKNASQHTKGSMFDDGSLADQEGSTTIMATVIDNISAKFTTSDVNISMAKIVAENAQVDKDNLVGYLRQIWTAKNNRMGKFIEDIITAYFEKNPSSSGLVSTEFVNFGLVLYRSIGTSKNPLYIEIKDILNFWMNNIINIKQFYTRDGTIISYTRAIFNYIILMINYYN